MRRPPAHVPPGVSRSWRLARLAVSGTGTSPAGVAGAPLRVWNARHLVAAASLLCSVPGVGAQEPPQRAPADWPQFRSTTVLPFGEPVIPVFEGWIPNPDGTITLSFGYFSPDPAMGAIWGGVLGGECGVDGEGAREREVSSFGGHGSAAMRRPEANRRRVSARRVAAGDMGPGIVGGTCMARVAAARLRRAPGAGCRGSVLAGP